MEWDELIKTIIRGYKRILFGIFLLIIAGAAIWGFISIILIIDGEVQFSWWYLPCWILLLSVIAGAIGAKE